MRVASATRTLAPAAAILIVTAAAVGAAPPPAAATHTVVIENLQFSPRELTVNRGDRIVWVNKDLFPHTATAEGKGFDSQQHRRERLVELRGLQARYLSVRLHLPSHHEGDAHGEVSALLVVPRGATPADL